MVDGEAMLAQTLKYLMYQFNYLITDYSMLQRGYS